MLQVVFLKKTYYTYIKLCVVSWNLRIVIYYLNIYCILWSAMYDIQEVLISGRMAKFTLLVAECVFQIWGCDCLPFTTLT